MTEKNRSKIQWGALISGVALLGSAFVGYFSGQLGTENRLGLLQSAQAAVSARQDAHDKTNDDIKKSIENVANRVDAVNQNLVQLLLKQGVRVENIKQ